MKAVVYDKKKSPLFLEFKEVEKPEPGDNEVLVKIIATSVNAADYRSMKMGIIPKRKIFGADIAGRIEEKGKNVIGFNVGDEVIGEISNYGFGGFAEYVSVPESALVLKPSGVAFQTAASVPLAAVTALQALRDKGNIKKGQKVLICGAGGGVGTFAVQLAKYFGTEVTAVCSEKNIQNVRNSGADHVIDYNKADFAGSGNRYDLVLAVNGNRPLSVYRRVLSDKGICVMVGGALSQIIKSILFGSLMSMGGKKMRVLAAKSSARDLDFVTKLVEEGKIKPVIDRCYMLDETPDAVLYTGKGHATGKVVISVQ